MIELGDQARALPQAQRTRWRFLALLFCCTVLLFLVLLAAAVLPSPWSWSVGLVYIGYDTWLLSHMLRGVRRAIAHEEEGPGEAPAAVSLGVVVAARNERADLPRTLEALLAQEVATEIVVVDDGSTDGTAEMLQRDYLPRFPLLKLLTASGTGKARALNQALEAMRCEVMVTVDADTVLDAGALAAIRHAFASEPQLAVACGVLRPVCRGGALSPAFQFYQRFEYLRAFLWRLPWSRENTLILVSGAFAAFRRDRLLEVGGFDPLSLVEDYEVMFRLHRASREHRQRPLRARVIGQARATTDSPGAAGRFLSQRTRWFAGYLETMFRNAELVGDPRFGRLGTVHLPIKTVDMLLPVYGLLAVLVLLVQLALGLRPHGLVLALVAFKLGFDLICHGAAVRMYLRWQGAPSSLGLTLRAAAATLTEPIGFQFLRQLGAVLGWVAFLRGRIEWGHQRLQAGPPRRIQGKTT